MSEQVEFNEIPEEVAGRFTPLIIDNISNGVIVLNRNLEVVCWNKAQEAASGFSRDEVRGKNIVSLFPQLKNNGLADDFRSVLRGENIKRPRISYRKDDGTIGYADRESNPLRDRKGKVIGIVSCITDVTEKVRLEKNLLWAQKFEDLGHMAAGLAHELNNLFTILQCETELALLQPENYDREKIIQTSGKVARMGGNLTRQLMNFARKPDQPFETADPKELVQGCIVLLKGVLATEKITMRTELADLPPIRINVSQIQQLIFNLVLNAKNAMKKGGVLKIRLKQENDNVKLTVSDNGPGIPSELVSKIFEPFITYSRSNSRLGTGLGLSICRDIVHNHGGEIKVRSRLGRGTSFIITLPISPDHLT
ncbi:MAG: ATP-binding protein [Candidatus Erginobacter occultus]|nr:ATP-binding protein [Candidatus Erginobacter occultus]